MYHRATVPAHSSSIASTTISSPRSGALTAQWPSGRSTPERAEQGTLVGKQLSAGWHWRLASAEPHATLIQQCSSRAAHREAAGRMKRPAHVAVSRTAERSSHSTAYGIVRRFVVGGRTALGGPLAERLRRTEPRKSRAAVRRTVHSSSSTSQLAESRLQRVFDHLLLDLRIFTLDVLHCRKVVSALAILTRFKSLDQDRFQRWNHLG